MPETFPSYMAVSDYSDGPAWSLSDTTLRLGEVVAAFPPDSPENKDPAAKGRQWVYVVNAAYRDADGARSIVPYRCTVADVFGGLADHLRHSVRATEGQTSSAFGRGAQVLLLCANGDKSQAFIVGGVRHGDAVDPDPSTVFFDFLFNGVHVGVDGDGALVVQASGATRADGSPSGTRSSDNRGSKVTISKGGVVTVDDQNGQKVVVDPASERVEVHGGHVVVFSDDVELGGDGLTEQDNGVVVADGIDVFTGLTYWELQNTSKKVKAKR